MRLMYVAGAYTGKTPEEVDLNIQAAAKVGQVVVRKGWYPIIPHMNTAGFDRTASEVTYDFWIEGTLEVMRRCDAVIMCPGWELSDGAVGELEIANQLKMPVYFDTFHLPEAVFREGTMSGSGMPRQARACNAYAEAVNRMYQHDTLPVKVTR